jgi:hypothetical protein
MDPLEETIAAARAYLAWCEAPPSGESGAPAVLALVAGLYASALRLDVLEPEAEPEALDAEPAIADERWRQVYERCRALPFDEYASIFDPHGDPAAEVVTASLADDLADVYRDVGAAVEAFDAGRPECARWQLTEGRRFHWGRHATGAIRALETFLADGRGP